MGYWTNRVGGLEPPFDVVHEQVVSVPAQGHLSVANSARKLLFVLGGDCRHQIVGLNGSNGDVHLRPGDVLSIPCRCEQRYQPCREGTAGRLHVVRLAFDAQCLPPLSLARPASVSAEPGEWTGLAGMVARQMSEVMYLPGGAGADSPLALALHELREEARLRFPEYVLRISGLCLSLIVLFVRQQAAQTAPDATPDAKLSPVPAAEFHVEQIKILLRQNLTHSLRLTDIAGHVCLSQEHTARIFRKSTGLTLSEYGRRLRIREAKNLLASTERNVSEIAALCGFGSLTVFSRNFKRETGMTPSEFRQQVAQQMG